LDAASRHNAVVFSEEDYYHRSCTADTWNGYIIEGFVLPDRYWGGVRIRDDKLTLTVMPMFEAIGAVFDFRVVPLPGQSVLLGLMTSKVETDFDAPSGFTLNGPSDLKSKEVLGAFYPAPHDLGIASLDYRQRGPVVRAAAGGGAGVDPVVWSRAIL